MVDLWTPDRKEAFEAQDEYTRELHKRYLKHLQSKPELNLKRVRKEITREDKLARIEENKQDSAPIGLSENLLEASDYPEADSQETLTHEKENHRSASIPPDTEEVLEDKITTLTETQRVSSAGLDTLPLKALDERSHLEDENNKVKRQRYLYNAGSIVGAAFLSVAAALKLSPFLSRFSPFTLPDWLSSLVIILLFTVFTVLPGWQVAKGWQLRREQKRLQEHPSDELAEIALIKPILKKEQNLSDEAMRQELKTYLQLRWQNKRLADVESELKMSMSLLVGMIIVLLVFNVLQFGFTDGFEGVFTGLFLSLFGAGALAATLLPLASVSLDNENISSFSVYDPVEAELKIETERKEQQKREEKEKKEAKLEREEQRIEAERKADIAKKEQEKKLKIEKAHVEQQKRDLLQARIEAKEEEQSDLYKEQQKSYEESRHELYVMLREATSKWEQLRGFEFHEIEHMVGMQKHHKLFFRLLMVGSLPISLLATYPASIVTTELLDFGYTYTSIGKFAVMSWLVWVAAVLLAEWFMASQLVKQRIFNYAHSVLLQGYDLSQRKKGMTYKVIDEIGLKRQLRGVKLLIVGCFIILALELFVNIMYIFSYSEGSWMAYAVSFIPMSLLILFAFLAADQKEPLSHLNDALGYGKVDLDRLQQRAFSRPQSARPPTSRDYVHDIENNIGPRPVSGGFLGFGKNRK